jgi:hypothetical protein
MTQHACSFRNDSATSNLAFRHTRIFWRDIDNALQLFDHLTFAIPPLSQAIAVAAMMLTSTAINKIGSSPVARHYHSSGLAR